MWAFSKGNFTVLCCLQVNPQLIFHSFILDILEVQLYCVFWSDHSGVKRCFSPLNTLVQNWQHFVLASTAHREHRCGQVYSKAVRLEEHSSDLIWMSWPEDLTSFPWVHCRGTAAIAAGDSSPGLHSRSWSDQAFSYYTSFYAFQFPPGLRSCIYLHEIIAGGWDVHY